MLEPVDIRQYWHRVKHQLDKLAKDHNCDWIPEDVYTACRTGSAQLWFADDCISILRQDRNEFTNQPELVIWIFIGDGRPQEKYIPQLEQIARSFGAKKMRMFSPRKGFERTGWKIDSVNYRREVI